VERSSPLRLFPKIFTYSRDLYTALAPLDVETYIVRWPRFGRKTAGLVENIARSIPEDAELIHVQHEYGLTRGVDETLYKGLKEHGKPIVTTMHAVSMYNIDKLVNRLSDQVIVHNEFCKEKFGGDSTIIHHGCNPVTPMPTEEAKKAMGIPPNVPIVGYIGFIAPQKGIEDIILAMEPIEKAGVVIGGGWHVGAETEYMDTLRQLGNDRLPGRIQWTGFVKVKNLAMVYGCMDLVVIPSRMATESGALLTAMAHGKPIIARDLAPFREKNLLTFKTAADLSAQIDGIIGDQDVLDTMKKETQAYAEENSWTKIAAKHKNLYEELI